jgi:hypothetical protein
MTISRPSPKTIPKNIRVRPIFSVFRCLATGLNPIVLYIFPEAHIDEVLESLTKPKIKDNPNHQKHEAGEENHSCLNSNLCFSFLGVPGALGG